MEKKTSPTRKRVMPKRQAAAPKKKKSSSPVWSWSPKESPEKAKPSTIRFAKSPIVKRRNSLNRSDRMEKAKTIDEVYEQKDRMSEELKALPNGQEAKMCVDYILTRYNIWENEDLDKVSGKAREAASICLKAYQGKKITKAQIKTINDHFYTLDAQLDYMPAQRKAKARKYTAEWKKL